MALKHPTWEMGPKITIDSATLFNKGLEMIEARWLFGITMDRIEAVIHPQSIVHSMVEFTDGSVLAQLSRTDMGFPIQYALTYPARKKGTLKPLDFTEISKLEFSAPRSEDFPSLGLARRAGLAGGTLPAVFNAANEIAVEAFVPGKSVSRISGNVSAERWTERRTGRRPISPPSSPTTRQRGIGRERSARSSVAPGRNADFSPMPLRIDR